MSLIPIELLKISNKILFITHLALGDFVYLQNFFHAFSNSNPNLKIHLWIDELRRTSDNRKWVFLKKYILYDWVTDCAFFEKVYAKTYNLALYKKSIFDAQKENYPIIVSIATLRPYAYINLARKISPKSFLVGIKNAVYFFQLNQYLTYKKLDAIILPLKQTVCNTMHISDIYAHWFAQISDLHLNATERVPFINIPVIWKKYALKVLTAWNFLPRKSQLIFINSYAKNKKRSWPLSYVMQLIIQLQKEKGWHYYNFIINTIPEKLKDAINTFNSYTLSHVQLFSAQENFFQLPAILAQCDLIISVETSVIHFASALKVPVIALMRQKNPEWAPIHCKNNIILTTPRRRDWIHAITIKQVIGVMQ